MKIPKVVPEVPEILLVLSTIVAVPSLIISSLYITLGIQVIKHPLLWSAQPEPLLLSKLDPNFHSDIARWSQHLSYNLQLGIVLFVVNVLLTIIVICSATIADKKDKDNVPFHEIDWFTNELSVNIITMLLMLLVIGGSSVALAITHDKHQDSIGVIDTQIPTKVIKDYKIEYYKVHVEIPFKQWNSGKAEYIAKIYKNTADKNSWYPKYKEIKTLKFDNYFDANHLNLKRFDK